MIRARPLGTSQPSDGVRIHACVQVQGGPRRLLPLGPRRLLARRNGEITDTGITATRSACPAVAIPAATGDITLFNPPSAAATPARSTWSRTSPTCARPATRPATTIVTSVTFDVQAQRRDARGAREVVLPYFAVVVQGGTNVQSKSVSRVGLRFADGQLRASTLGLGDRPGARARGDPARGRPPADHPRAQARRSDAAIDPMADPAVREAVRGPASRCWSASS